MYVAAAAIVPLTTSFYPLIACALVFGVADACRVPASVALFTEIGTASRALTSLSLRSLLWKPGAVLAPLLAGLIHDYATIGLVFYATAAVVLVSVTVAAWLDASQSMVRSASPSVIGGRSTEYYRFRLT